MIFFITEVEARFLSFIIDNNMMCGSESSAAPARMLRCIFGRPARRGRQDMANCKQPITDSVDVRKQPWSVRTWCAWVASFA